MDFNAGEIVILLVFGIIVFGPEKLPELARKAARVLNYVRKIANDARGQLRQELGDELGDLKLSDLNPRAFVAKHVLGPDVTDPVSAVAEDLRGGGRGVDAQLDTKPVSPGGPGDVALAPVPVARATPFDPEAT